jgi:pimeloyl-ACP methyl ester carboxylesterase
VPIARPAAPKPGEYESWKASLLGELKRMTFRALPEGGFAAQVLGESPSGKQRLETERGIEVRITQAQKPSGDEKRTVLIVLGSEDGDGLPKWAGSFVTPQDRVVLLQPRGAGETRWTAKNPPNYVARSHVLLGRTVDTGRVQDVVATSQRLAAAKVEGKPAITVAGRGASGLLAAYAALLTPEIQEVIVVDPPASHMDSAAPALLNILRICDVPEMLGMLAPRRLELASGSTDLAGKVGAIYAAAGAEDWLSLRRD